MAKLRNYSWPGNIRELRNVVERAVIITQGPMLSLIDKLEPRPAASDSDQPSNGDELNQTLEQHEYNLILHTLSKVHWKLEGPGGAAELLNIHPSTLRSRMRKLRIERPRIIR
jgi:DNA-binding NtrC family response regulator